MPRSFRELNRTIRRRGASANLLVGRGDLYRASRQYASAQKDYQDAIELDSENAAAHFGMGLLFVQAGRSRRAIEYFEMAVELDATATHPAFAKSYESRGLAFCQAGQLDLGIADLTRAIALDPDLGSAYYNRALAYSEKGEAELGIQDLGDAIRINPEDSDAHFSRAHAYAEEGKLELAITDYSTVITLEPAGEDAYFNRGLAYTKLNDLDAAVKDMEAAAELNPRYIRDLSETLKKRGDTFQAEGDNENAVVYYSRAIELDSSDALTFNNRASAHSSLGNHDSAVDDARKSSTLDAKYLVGLATALSNRGIASARGDKYETAIADLKEASQLDDSHSFKLSTVYLNRGVTFQNTGDFRCALDDATKAILYSSEWARAYNFRGLCYQNLGDLDRAKTDFDAAVAIAGDESAPYINRAINHMGMNGFIGIQPITEGEGTVFLEEGTGVSDGEYTEVILEDLDDAVRLCPDYYEANYIDNEALLVDDSINLVLMFLKGVIGNPRETEFDYYYSGVREIFLNEPYDARIFFEDSRLLGNCYEEKSERHLQNLKNRK